MIFWATPSCGPSVCLDQWIGLSDGVIWSDGNRKKGNSKIPNDLQLCDGGSNVLFFLFTEFPMFHGEIQSRPYGTLTDEEVKNLNVGDIHEHGWLAADFAGGRCAVNFFLEDIETAIDG